MHGASIELGLEAAVYAEGCSKMADRHEDLLAYSTLLRDLYWLLICYQANVSI